MKITEQMTILDILKAAPETRRVFDRHNMACKGCQGAGAESLALGAWNHGVDVKILVKELNEAAKAAD